MSKHIGERALQTGHQHAGQGRPDFPRHNANANKGKRHAGHHNYPKSAHRTSQEDEHKSAASSILDRFAGC